MYNMEKDKSKSTTRILVIKPMEGAEVTTSKGLVDPRLWKGGNELSAVMDTANCSWRLKYKAGGVPPQLQGMYTNFSKAYSAAVDYFKTRGLQVVEVID